MSDYTPTVGRVRTVYMDHRLDCIFADCTESMAQAEFDRAIAKVRAEAKAEAWDEGWDAGWINAWDNAKSTSSKVTTSPNPYRADNLEAS